MGIRNRENPHLRELGTVFRNQFPRPITLPGIRTAIGLDRGGGVSFARHIFLETNC